MELIYSRITSPKYKPIITHKSMRTLAATLIVFGSFASVVNATIHLQFSEAATSVVVTYTGSIDLAATLGKEADRSSVIEDAWGSPNVNHFRNTKGGNLDDYNVNFTATPQFMDGYFTAVGSGDDFLIEADEAVVSRNQIWVSDNYVSGAPISGTLTFEGESFTSMGIIEGTHVWTWENGGVSDSAIFTTVPEPSSALLLGLGAVGLLATRRRRM